MELAALLVGALIVNNFVLAQFLGLCPFFGTTGRVDTAMAMGLATTFVLCLAASLSHIVYHAILLPFELEYLKIIAFIVIVAGAVQLTEMYVKATSRTLYQLLGIFLPLITTNCAVLGVALLSVSQDLSFLETFVFSVGAALGFTLVMAVFSAMRERLNDIELPEAMAGTPATLVSAGILALAFLGFQGLA